MIANIARCIAVLIREAAQVIYLLTQLGIFRLKMNVLNLKLRYLLFERSILLRSQRKALAKYCSRAVLSNKSLNVLEDSHADTSNVQIEARPASGASLSNAGLDTGKDN